MPEFITDKATRRILKCLGYKLGRWIYILDAFDDIEGDVKNGNYNKRSNEYLCIMCSRILIEDECMGFNMGRRC